MMIENLATELLTLVLEATSSPRQLHDLISASPRCFRIFRHSPEQILSAVIRNGFRDNLHHALAAFHAYPAGLIRSRELHKNINRYFDNEPYDFPTEREDLVSLCWLLTHVDDLCNGFVTNASRHYQRLKDMKSGTNNTSVEGPQMPIVLRSVEEARLRRAFLRFELYCKFFPVLRRNRDDSGSLLGADDQLYSFIYRLMSWEVEEMVSVFEYMSSIAESALNEIETMLVKEVMSVPGIRKLESDKPDSGYVDFKSLGLTDLCLFSRTAQRTREDHLSYLTGLGLDFVYSLVHCLRDTRVELVRATTPATREFLPEALERELLAFTEAFERPLNLVDDLSEPNYGYQIFNKSYHRYGSAHRPGFYGESWDGRAMRQLGYAFWDSQRMTTSWVWSDIFPNQLEGDPYFDRSSKICVEEQLEGFQIPMEDMARICEKFRPTFDGPWSF